MLMDWKMGSFRERVTEVPFPAIAGLSVCQAVV